MSAEKWKSIEFWGEIIDKVIIYNLAWIKERDFFIDNQTFALLMLGYWHPILRYIFIRIKKILKY